MQKLQSLDKLFGNDCIEFVIVNILRHKCIQIASITKFNHKPQLVVHQMTRRELAF